MANHGANGSKGASDPLVGRRLASYEVLSRVARGGMGVVYRARHVYIDKIVALKVLDPKLSARPELIDRFRTEAQSLARVEHENVVKVIDILEDKGVYFIVMDFAEGVNLRLYVKKNGPVRGDELLSVARQTAEALYAAHREGILHRDIKPENLILNSRGRCKLADFGLAGDLRLISEGHDGPLNFGTPAYSAPEVLRRMKADKRCDIFSYGATLYFLATGEPPFGQTGSQQILMRQKQGAEPLEAHRPDLGPKFSRLVADCLAWNPKDRPDSLREVLDRLPRRAFASPPPRAGATPTEATGPTSMLTTDRASRELSPRVARWMALAGIAVGAASVLLVVILWWSQRGAGKEHESDPARAETRTPGLAPGSRESLETATPGPGPSSRPGFRADQDAFHAAELDSRSAMLRADYSAAWGAWSRFMQEHPSSEMIADARSRRETVRQRVLELREQEFQRLRKACEEALAGRRTADALAALARFPDELLAPFSPEDDLAVAEQLETQRRLVKAAEAIDLASVLGQADGLRATWKEYREEGDSWNEARRTTAAAGLLRERELLENFLPGRLTETQELITRRLGALRKLLETIRQEAADPVKEWRHYHDRTLGEWARELYTGILRMRALAARRDFAAALREGERLDAELSNQAASLRFQFEELAAHASGAEFLRRQLREFIADLTLASGLVSAVEEELRRSDIVREYQVYSVLGEDGRGRRPVRLTGRLVSVGAGEAVISTDAGRQVVKLDMLTPGGAVRLIRGTDRPERHLALIAWLVAQGAETEARDELRHMEASVPVLDTDRRHARTMAESGQLGSRAGHRLLYVFASRGALPAASPLSRLPEDSLEGRLLRAQATIESGGAARDYLRAAREADDPVYIHLATLERALGADDPEEADLRLRVNLEPFSADALAALAQFLDRRGERASAREIAGRALLLDNSNVAAWGLWRR